ncbi:hypothetical protein RKD37_002567 [Streptomyces ambofaciens]
MRAQDDLEVLPGVLVDEERAQVRVLSEQADGGGVGIACHLDLSGVEGVDSLPSLGELDQVDINPVLGPQPLGAGHEERRVRGVDTDRDADVGSARPAGAGTGPRVGGARAARGRREQRGSEEGRAGDA